MQLYILGNGGHAHELFDELFLEKTDYIFQGFITINGGKAFVVNEVGFKPFIYEESAAFITGTQNQLVRKLFIDYFTNLYDATTKHFPNIASSKAHVSKSALLGIGNIFSPFSSVHGMAQVGNFNSFSSYSSAYNCSKIGNNNILYPYAGIMNNCIVGNENILHPNSILTEKVAIGDANVISAGECVFDTVNNNELFQSGIILKKPKE